MRLRSYLPQYRYCITTCFAKERKIVSLNQVHVSWFKTPNLLSTLSRCETVVIPRCFWQRCPEVLFNEPLSRVLVVIKRKPCLLGGVDSGIKTRDLQFTQVSRFELTPFLAFWVLKKIKWWNHQTQNGINFNQWNGRLSFFLPSFCLSYFSPCSDDSRAAQSAHQSERIHSQCRFYYKLPIS